MATVVLSPFDVANFPDGGGHFWVYMQYAQGLRRLGCDVYFTIGETVGTPTAPFPDCGARWVHIRPPVCLELWPYVHDPRCEAFTTVAGWWSGKWVKVIEDGRAVCHDNNKRVAFLEYAALPERTAQPLELALLLADGDVADRGLLERHRWRIRDAREVASTPQRYQAYIQGSRGE